MAIREERLTEDQALSQGIEYDLIPPNWLFYLPQLTHIKLLLADQSSESLLEARTQLEIINEDMRKFKRNNVRIDVLALIALVCDRQYDESGAFENLSVALSLGNLGGTMRTFVDLGKPMASLLLRLKRQHAGGEYEQFIERMLETFPEAQILRTSASQSQLAEPLTGRELEVLGLLAQRLSNKEIAAKLVISTRTVKRHTEYL